MYGKKELSVKNIKSKLSCFDLFSYYCTPFKDVNTIFCSELRKDSNPTCSVHAFEGKLFYKDFSTGDSFDAIGYIQHKYNISFMDTLAYINRDFNLNLSGKRIEGIPTMQFFGIPDKSITIEDYTKESTTIKVQRRKWTIHDASFWKDRYLFTSKELEFFNVYPIKFFWINNRIYKCKNNSYAFFMGIGNDGIEKWKIYQPLGPKEEKWFSNISKHDIQGEEQLPETGDVLYITSSLKDVITLRKLKLYAVAPSAESTIIDIEKIEEFKKRFKKVIIFYDNDEPGLKAAYKHGKLYGVDSIIIPIHSKVKDPSDFVEKYSYDELLKIIKNEQN